MTRYYSDCPKEVTPASERLLLALFRSDKGEGVNIRYLSHGRYRWDGPHQAPFNFQSFLPLHYQGLVTGWSNAMDEGPLLVTDKGKEYAIRLDAKDTERRNRLRRNQ